MYDQAAKKQTVLYFPNAQLGPKEEEMRIRRKLFSLCEDSAQTN